MKFNVDNWKLNYIGDKSIYKPHQSNKECLRRKRQMQRGILNFHYIDNNLQMLFQYGKLTYVRDWTKGGIA